MAHDLTTPAGVSAFMATSRNEAEWNDNCDAVKAANKGYPNFWFDTIVLSGLMDKTLKAVGVDPEIRITEIHPNRQRKPGSSHWMFKR